MSDDRESYLIPEGTYRARADVSGVCWGKSSNSNEQLAVPFRIKDEGPGLGKTKMWIRAFTNDAKQAEITRKGLEAAGWDGVSLRTLDGLGTLDVDLVIVHREYNGKMHDEIQWVNKPGGAGFAFKQGLRYEELDKLDARFARMCGKAPSVQGRRNDPPPRDAPPPPEDDPNIGGGRYGGSDDDIPF